MLYESHLQSKVISLVSPAIRADRQADYQTRRDILILQARAEKAEKQARVNRLIERWNHAIVLSDLCKRLASVYAVPCNVNNADIFKMMEAYAWKCPASGKTHSDDNPISLFFVVPLERGGAITINNIKPRWYKGRLPGEWIIKRDNLVSYPPASKTPALEETQEFQAVAA